MQVLLYNTTKCSNISQCPHVLVHASCQQNAHTMEGSLQAVGNALQHHNVAGLKGINQCLPHGRASPPATQPVAEDRLPIAATASCGG